MFFDSIFFIQFAFYKGKNGWKGAKGRANMLAWSAGSMEKRAMWGEIVQPNLTRVARGALEGVRGPVPRGLTRVLTPRGRIRAAKEVRRARVYIAMSVNIQ